MGRILLLSDFAVLLITVVSSFLCRARGAHERDRPKDGLGNDDTIKCV